MSRWKEVEILISMRELENIILVNTKIILIKAVITVKEDKEEALKIIESTSQVQDSLVLKLKRKIIVVPIIIIQPQPIIMP